MNKEPVIPSNLAGAPGGEGCSVLRDPRALSGGGRQPGKRLSLANCLQTGLDEL